MTIKSNHQKVPVRNMGLKCGTKLQWSNKLTGTVVGFPDSSTISKKYKKSWCFVIWDYESLEGLMLQKAKVINANRVPIYSHDGDLLFKAGELDCAEVLTYNRIFGSYISQRQKVKIIK